jgi:hypothetical protein
MKIRKEFSDWVKKNNQSRKRGKNKQILPDFINSGLSHNFGTSQLSYMNTQVKPNRAELAPNNTLGFGVRRRNHNKKLG